MRRQSLFSSSLVAVLLTLSLAAPAMAANSTIGYVDMQRVLEESKVGKRIQEQLRKEFEPRARTLSQDEAEIQQMQQALERDKPLMSKDQADKKEKEIQSRIEAYQKKAMPIQQELMKAQQTKGREVIGPAREAVDAVAKKKKLGMVIERNLAGLIFIDEGLDISAEVIKELDSKTK